jgi:PAS domain S-box-containing protein
MKSPLRILYLEDNLRDAELVQEILAADGMVCEVARVENEADFVASLEQGGDIDLILADYTLPSFDGLSALKIARQKRPHVPFIFVSGTLGEEVAIEALKIGATDYVFKTRLSRLAPSVRRALREAEEKIGLSQAEEALRRSEAYLAEAQKLSHTGSFGWDVASGEIFWSRETFRIFGYEPVAKATIEMVMQRIHPEDRPSAMQLIVRVCSEMKDFDFEHRLLMPDGSVKHVHFVAHAVKDGTGKLEFVGAVMDISERKRAEEVLRRSERDLHEAQRLSHTGSYRHDILSGTVTSSPESHRMWRTGPDDDTSSPEFWFGRMHPEDRERFRELYQRCIIEKADYEADFRIVLPDGTVKYQHSVGHPIRNESGDLVEYIGTTTDITERKHAEEALRRSEADLLEAQKLSHTGNWRHELSSGTVTASPEMLRVWGVKPDEDHSRAEFWFDRIHPQDRERIRELFERSVIQRTEYQADYPIVLPDGTINHIHVIGHPILSDSGELVEFVGTTMDVTEQHNARNALEKAFEEIKTLKDQLYRENIALREQIDHSLMFEEIVGGSPALQSVLARVAKVAPTDSTALITGETGTGKELFARAIHKRSRRSSRPFVSVNCAATPATLIASELFGHEKGAFTGASQRRLGRFELAEGGTIFLDEVGELPLETQVALLRVLQEREFERVGGSQVIRTDVRVLAATNRDLESAIADGAFRKDLFYRLNVFPIEIPSLRERREDIPTLVEYFVHRYSRNVGKKIRAIEKRTLELLVSYAWPGNIRELQNVIERSVIFCETDLFTVDPSWLSFESSAPSTGGAPITKMSPAQERETIEKALAAAAGRVSGPSGAAAQLSIPASTLESKIRALKINKFRFKKI